ncbi:hypothetical protein OH76DRAFT_150731 [Lentinus brumalis]|uniref:Uncharacterized protein n=1 Tax=Lentinus brumalis TaxID=2498619 RepID=A0A371CNU1_9APHY|nr:hypothetical protein OH76DRAFT_150731 [Polyporus brumalis]
MASGRFDDVTPHFVGQAVAALRYTNDKRRDASQEELMSATFVGISMMKGAPVFHKIRVTRQLLDAVQDGAAVNAPTTVERFIPNSTSASPPRGLETKGECRRYLCRCFEACRLLVEHIASPAAPECGDVEKDVDMDDV